MRRVPAVQGTLAFYVLDCVQLGKGANANVGHCYPAQECELVCEFELVKLQMTHM